MLSKSVIKLFHWDLVVVVNIKSFEDCILFCVGDVNVHWAETVCEFIQINEFVAIFVESLEQVDCVSLQAGVVASWCFYLSHDWLQWSFWEYGGVVFHVLNGVLVAAHQHKFESYEEDSAAKHEIFLWVVALVDWVSLLFALHETTTNASTVLVTDFVDLDSVITAVETNDESACLIIRIGWDKLWVETQNVHVLFKHLFHVKLRGFGLKSDHTSHRVFVSTVTSMRRNSLIENIWAGLSQDNWVLSIV